MCAEGYAKRLRHGSTFSISTFAKEHPPTFVEPSAVSVASL